MIDFFNFNKLVTTSILKGVYLLGAFVITIGSFVSTAQGGSGVLAGLIGVILGNLIWRVVCENIIVLFDIHDTLFSIDESL